MREIKFRAWSKEQNKMVYPDELGYFDSVYLGTNGYFQTVSLGNVVKQNGVKVYVMQYTGLKDKNGQEIYEGDIVQNLRGIKNKVYWEPEISAWNCERFRDNNNRISYLMLYELADVATLEIIGNIYEGVN
jgi:uncharacterized phage protein (TIGR01671 family)